jgi:hypothetical protein
MLQENQNELFIEVHIIYILQNKNIKFRMLQENQNELFIEVHVSSIS